MRKIWVYAGVGMVALAAGALFLTERPLAVTVVRRGAGRRLDAGGDECHRPRHPAPRSWKRGVRGISAQSCRSINPRRTAGFSRTGHFTTDTSGRVYSRDSTAGPGR